MKVKQHNMWTKTEIGKYYNVSTQTINSWIVKYGLTKYPFPQPIYVIGGSRKYSIKAVKVWLANPLKDL